PRIEACTSCENFNLAQSDLFSQFVIPAGINVPIGVRLNSGTTQNQAYWMEVLLILSFVGFGAYLILRTRRQINRGLATPLTQIVDAIDNEREDLELDQSAVYELKLVVKSLKSWRKRFLAAQKVQAEAQMVTLARQVAHDIRSPLSAIQIAAASIEKSPAEAKQLIAQSASRIQSIAEDILTKSRNKCDTQTTDINQICKEIAQEKNAVIPNHRKIEILTICEENIRASQSVSDSDLRRVLSNLINNSIDACGEIGEIKIKATKNSSICVIDIIDNGKGIPEELAHNIGCEGFTYGKATGNGLGLFNAKQLVQSWGGTISIHSKEDVGTTVSMQLPLSNC
ncbi:MAG: HAMP domain-containing histidine kinase, partial [Bdellovibrionales bacterium]|nr:HAMP domain-containing histidine kinase [Bdellovibrionales bacterium]